MQVRRRCRPYSLGTPGGRDGGRRLLVPLPHELADSLGPLLHAGPQLAQVRLQRPGAVLQKVRVGQLVRDLGEHRRHGRHQPLLRIGDDAAHRDLQALDAVEQVAQGVAVSGREPLPEQRRPRLGVPAQVQHRRAVVELHPIDHQVDAPLSQQSLPDLVLVAPGQVAQRHEAPKQLPHMRLMDRHALGRQVAPDLAQRLPAVQVPLPHRQDHIHPPFLALTCPVRQH